MEIRDKFDKIKSVIDMHVFMQDIKTEVSFWGCRYVIKKDHSGYLFIDDLAGKILSLAESLHYKYTPNQRTLGTRITTLITDFYEELNKKNLLTRIFAFLRDFFSSIISQGFLPALSRGFLSKIEFNWCVRQRGDIFNLTPVSI